LEKDDNGKERHQRHRRKGSPGRRRREGVARPGRVQSTGGEPQSALNADLVRTIHGFDALLVLTGSTASANL